MDLIQEDSYLMDQVHSSESSVSFRNGNIQIPLDGTSNDHSPLLGSIQSIEKKKKEPYFSRLPLIIAIILTACFVITNVVVVAVHFISEKINVHVDYLSFAWLLFIDIFFVGSVLSVFFAHFIIFLFGKLLQYLEDKNLFIIYNRLIKHSMSFGIFFWLLIVVTTYEPLSVRFIFYSDPYKLFAVLLSALFVSFVGILAIILKTIFAQHIFFEKRGDAREWNLQEKLVRKLERSDDFEFSPQSQFLATFDIFKIFRPHPGKSDFMEIEITSRTMKNIWIKEGSTAAIREIASQLLRSINPQMVLEIEDLEKLFPGRTDYALHSMDMDRDGVVSLDDMVAFLEGLWKRRSKLKHWLKNRGLLLDTSDYILSVLSFIAYLFILFGFIDQFTEFPWNSFLVSLGSILISMGFAYARVLQEFVDALHMIFVMRPFQVGDKIILGQLEPKIIYTVDNVFILYSILSHSGGYQVYVRNSFIANSQISNLSQEKRARMQLSVQLRSSEVLSSLTRSLSLYLESQSIISKKFQISIDQFHSIKHLLDVTLSFNFKYKMCFQNSEYFNAKNELLKVLETCLASEIISNNDDI